MAKTYGICVEKFVYINIRADGEEQLEKWLDEHGPDAILELAGLEKEGYGEEVRITGEEDGEAQIDITDAGKGGSI